MNTNRADYPLRPRRLTSGASRAAAALFFAASIVFAVATQASAAITYEVAQSQPDYNCSSGWDIGEDLDNGNPITFAKGCINKSGNFGVKDTLSDGYRVGILWQKHSDTSIGGICSWAGGEGTIGRCQDHISYAINMRVVRCNATVSACNQMSDWSAYQGWVYYSYPFS